ncbi:hypothetical protein JCM11491_001807 [Sporobolomyces phaffii]
MIAPLPDINVSELGVPSSLGQARPLSGRASTKLRDSVQSERGGSPLDGRSVAESPPVRRGRNLVICLDGTLNTVGENPTNVLQLFSLCDEDPLTQIRHYQTGIGINLSSWKRSSPLASIKRTLDSAVAYRLGEHVTLAYRFLVRLVTPDWQPQDRIFVFGFSRGAYAARCLAGMIEQVGLLSQGNENSISLAYEIYKRSEDPGDLPGGRTLAGYFANNFTRPVRIDFLGVWDTVSSIGAIVPRHLPFSTSSSAIVHFRQAVALDERRCLYGFHPHHSSTQDASPEKTVQEVFFAGAHSDVGGGSFPASDGPALSNVSLKWMLKEALEHGLKLGPALDIDPRFSPFRAAAISALEDPHSVVARYVSTIVPHSSFRSAEAFALALLYLANDPFSPTSIADARAPRSDALSFNLDRDHHQAPHLIRRLSQRMETLGWRVLELLPVAKRRWSTSESRFKLTFRPGFSSARRIPSDAVLHESVLIRRTTPVDSFPPGHDKSVPERVPYTPKAKEKVPGKGKKNA